MAAYLVQLGVFSLMFAVLALSYNLLYGYLGITSMAHAGFWGVGAYATAATSVVFGWPWVFGAALGAAIAALIGAVVAIPASRLRGHYLLISTVGLHLILQAFFINWTGVTGGAVGIRDIPRPNLFGFLVDTPEKYLILATVLCGLVMAITYRLGESPFGRMLKAIRDDDSAALALGKNVVRTKVIAFALTGSIAVLAGSFLASWVTFVDPANFTLLNSFLIMSIVAIGGAGRFVGSLVGVVAVITLPELMRLLPIPGGQVAPIRQILIGLSLVLFMLFRPQGLIPEHGRRRIEPFSDGTNSPSSGVDQVGADKGPSNATELVTNRYKSGDMVKPSD